MKYIILTSSQPGRKPCLINIEDIAFVEPNYDATESRVCLRNGNSVTVVNAPEDVIARLIEATAPTR